MKQLRTSISFLICTLLFNTTLLNAQQFNWVRGGGTNVDLSTSSSSQWEQTKYVCTDLNGNVYALSQVSYTTVYADTFTGVGSFVELNTLVTSYNCSGQMRWAKLLTCSGDNTLPQSIVVDSLGHVYVAADFSGYGDVHIGSDTLTPSSHFREGIVQFDTNGHFNWLRFAGDNSVASHNGIGGAGNTLSIDRMSNVHLISYMNSNVVLSPGYISHMGTYDLMYNPAGTLSSIKKLQLDSTLEIQGATIDKQSSKLYTYGYRNLNFWTLYGGDSSYHAYLAEFDTARNQVWMDTLGDPASTSGVQGFSGIAPDGAGHLYVSGGADGNLLYQNNIIGPPPGAVGSNIAFVMKMDTAGNMIWIEQSNCHYNIADFGLTLTGNNKVAAVGNFVGLASNGADTIYSPTNTPFLTVLDTSGTLVALQRIEGDGFYNRGMAIASDTVGNLYIGGFVSDTIPDTLIPSYHTVGGNTDFFVLKYGVDCSCTSMPVAAYTYTVTGFGMVSVNYTGTTTGLDSVVWHFGDGTKALGLSASHTYTVVGTVDLCVTVYTSCGYDIYCDSLTVNCPGTPVSSFTSSGSLPVSFNYTGTTLALDSVKWAYGDGATGIGTAPAHAYSVSGTYTVCATAYTACGYNTSCNSVTVSCTAAAAFSDTGIITKGFTYTGSTVGIDSVKWDFGDGSPTVTGNTHLHTYTAVGTYTVCATVYTACGSNTACNAVTVPCLTAPVASFSDTGTHAIGFVYMGTTTGIDSVVWNFGDGNTSHGDTVFHTYATADTYRVCVTAYNPCGHDSVCHNVIEHPLRILSLAQANIQVYPNPATNELMVTGIISTTNYRLLNVTGMSIQHGTMHPGSNTVSIQNFAPGIYILEMTVEDGERNIVRVVKE